MKLHYQSVRFAGRSRPKMQFRRANFHRPCAALNLSASAFAIDRAFSISSAVGSRGGGK